MKKYAVIYLCTFLLFPVYLFSQTGADCANAIPLTMDGVCRVYTASSSLDTCKICTNPIYSGSSPVTFFSFTTNSTPDNVLINITAPTPQPCEVLMYSSSSCTPPLSASGMCFDDGQGLWAPAHSYTLLPNTTYHLRIKTTTTGNITICAQHYTPLNDDCAGAMAIGPTPVPDNNSCHKAGPGVTAAQLCGSTLENTAFYRYVVEHDGVSILNINNIDCDNGATNNSTGMQVGFFTGNCSSLTSIGCYSATGPFVSATTDILPAGTNVYVAIDGVAGSNCRYEINVINSQVLAADIKNFAAWKKPVSNLLTWESLREIRNNYFEVERSENGRDFITIGRVSAVAAKRNYEFNDPMPPLRCYYRLKQVDMNGLASYYNTILVVRNSPTMFQLNFQNPVSNTLHLNLQSQISGPVKLRIVSMNGVVIMDETVRCQQGMNNFTKNLSSLAAGSYLLEAILDATRVSRLFIKTNTGQ
ncbi:MAG TPA: T9SS type A sorting domain-containing protein [Chitinophagaceae bacterium]